MTGTEVYGLPVLARAQSGQTRAKWIRAKQEATTLTAVKRCVCVSTNTTRAVVGGSVLVKARVVYTEHRAEYTEEAI